MFSAIYGSRTAVVPSDALTQPNRRAWGGPVDGAAAFGLVPRQKMFKPTPQPEGRYDLDP